MKRLVIGDIHGGRKAIDQILDRSGVTLEDHLIFLGDYVDGWSDAVPTVDYLMELQEKYTCTFIRGNHDELVKQWLVEQNDNPNWIIHGGAATKASYLEVSKEKWKQHISFYNALEDYFIDEDNRLYLHAGFTHLKGIEHEYFKQMFYWDRTLWELAKAVSPQMSLEDKNYPERLKNYKEVFIGHTPLSKVGRVNPKNGANVWNVDTGAAFKGCLTIMDVETKEFWQSDPVYTLYPGENGRN